MSDLKAIRAFRQDAVFLSELQQELGLPNQQLLVNNLVKIFQETQDLKDRLLDVESQLEQVKDSIVETGAEVEGINPLMVE